MRLNMVLAMWVLVIGVKLIALAYFWRTYGRRLLVLSLHWLRTGQWVAL